MKCFYHPSVDAVATCSHCGKAGCQSCIWDTGGTMTCASCYNLSVAEYNKGSTKAVWRIIRSVIFAFIGSAVIGSVATSNGLNGLLAYPVGLYCAWCIYWGVPTVWGWWTGLFKRIGCFLFLNPVGWLILILFFFYIPLVFGFMYGFYGGAFYQFYMSLKIARSRAQPITIS